MPMSFDFSAAMHVLGAVLVTAPAIRASRYYYALFKIRGMKFSSMLLQEGLEITRIEIRRHGATIDLLDYGMLLIGSLIIIVAYCLHFINTMN